MRRLGYSMIMVWFLSNFSGCTLCCSPYDLDYAATGSKLTRMDRQNGRLGSPFSDPDYVVSQTGMVQSDLATDGDDVEYEQYVEYEEESSPSDQGSL